jgi:anthranilate 1,2-dioxygenase large subunit
MEDAEAIELVQQGIIGDGASAASVLEMSRSAPDQRNSLISESLVRRFWVGYQKLMGFESASEIASSL